MPELRADCASDGQRYRYLACWGVDDQVECATLAPQSGELVTVFTGAGFTPAVAHGAAGWLVAWGVGEPAPTQIVLQKLGPDFERLDDPVAFPSTTVSPTHSGNPFVIAAPNPAMSW